MSLATYAARDRRPVRRRVAALTAFAVALAHLTALAHLAETPHHWCAEHQVAEDVEAVADASTTGQRHNETTLTDTSTRAVHAHDGCALAGVSLTTVLASSSTTLDVAHAAALPQVTVPPAPPARAEALYRLAPKTSPPQA